MEISEDELFHYGTKRHSGRYPWGSGDEPHQHSCDFLEAVNDLRRQGVTDAVIAQGYGMSSGELRAYRSIATNEKKAADRSRAEGLRAKGYSNVAIAKELGITEGTVRNYLAPGEKVRADSLTELADYIQEQVDRHGYIDVGSGNESWLNVSSTKFNTALELLQARGYKLHSGLKTEQLGTGKMTTVKVLGHPESSWAEVNRHRELIRNMMESPSLPPPSVSVKLKDVKMVDPKRVAVRYASEGGDKKDGVIELRRGVPDISLGANKYAQVRIGVGGTHYLKGMAVYADDLPKGTDIRFNTSKENTGNKLDAMKPLKETKEGSGIIAEDLPFGSIVKKHTYLDEHGKEHTSALNIVNDEGTWDGWSRNLPSQMLSKQPASVAKTQLQLARDRKQQEFDQIMSLNNAAVKKNLLDKFAESCDSDALHMKAAAMPRQRTQVILPVPSLKANEIYAPNFKHGEQVVLIRFPHGGRFEIPELVVNNRNKEAKGVIGGSTDAVGINHKVAQRLSGADFDGDTVLVIPNNSGAIKSEARFKELENFEPHIQYAGYEGMKVMKKSNVGRQMGDISNLITDMTIKGASDEELCRAVKHSMVVIDAHKHKLNYKQSEQDNRIRQLKAKYQGGETRGASTLISRATSQAHPEEKKLRSMSKGGPIDKKTGELIYEKTGVQEIRNGKPVFNADGTPKMKTMKSTKMAETKDAHTLVSDNGGTIMENIYADHANSMKAMANKARLASLNSGSISYSPSANKAYAPQVKSLRAKLTQAQKNAPLERQAQLLAGTVVKAKRQDNPGMEYEELKKIKSQALTEMRARVGAKKAMVEITPDEWEAIQSGAISNHFLTEILKNTDIDKVKAYAMPKEAKAISGATLSRAQAMRDRGYENQEIADALGVSVSTVVQAFSPKHS